MGGGTAGNDVRYGGQGACYCGDCGVDDAVAAVVPVFVVFYLGDGDLLGGGGGGDSCDRPFSIRSRIDYRIAGVIDTWDRCFLLFQPGIRRAVVILRYFPTHVIFFIAQNDACRFCPPLELIVAFV